MNLSHILYFRGHKNCYLYLHHRQYHPDQYPPPEDLIQTVSQLNQQHHLRQYHFGDHQGRCQNDL